MGEAWATCRRQLRVALLDPAIEAVVCLVGTPAAGKSTWGREHDRPDVVIFDACWAQRGKREGLARQIRLAGKQAIAVWVRVPLDVARDRNAARPPDRRVPDVALTRAWLALRAEPPTVAEGWHRVVVQDGQAVRESLHDAAVPPETQIRRAANAPANQAWALARARLLPAYAQAMERAGDRRGDVPPRVAQSLRGVARAMERGASSDESLARAFARAGERAELGVRRAWEQQVSAELGQRWLAEPQDIEAWAEKAAADVADVRRRVAPGLEASIAEAWRKGWSARDLEAHWREHGLPLDGGGTAEGRASVLGARQHAQVLASVTKAHQAAVGAEEYEWGPTSSRSPDPVHAGYRGKRFRWSDPPPGGHPGERPGCHCSAKPVIDELAAKHLREEIRLGPLHALPPARSTKPKAPAKVKAPKPPPTLTAEPSRAWLKIADIERDIKGSPEAASIQAWMERLDPAIVKVAQRRGGVLMIRHLITDEIPHLKGLQPRGWPPGET